MLWYDFKNKKLIVLYFETSNSDWSNKKVKWLGTYAINYFIKIAKQNKLNFIEFDILPTAIWFYKKLEKRIQNSKIIKQDQKELFIIKVE